MISLNVMSPSSLTGPWLCFSQRIVVVGSHNDADVLIPEIAYRHFYFLCFDEHVDIVSGGFPLAINGGRWTGPYRRVEAGDTILINGKHEVRPYLVPVEGAEDPSKEMDLCRARIAELERALRNVRLLAARVRRKDPENAEHLLRFCSEAGVLPSIVR